MTNVQQEVEIWKDVSGFEGIYQVSNLGRVRSLDRMIKKWDGKRITRGKVLSPSVNKLGYNLVSLHHEGKIKPITVHRLVMLTFVGEPPVGKPNVLHNDDNPSNNRLDNLKYGSQSENIKDCISRGRYKCNSLRKNQDVSHLRKPVNRFTLNGEHDMTFISLSEAARRMGCNINTIQAVIKGKRKTAKGFLWKYAA